MPFADEFINGVLAGQQVKGQRQDEEYRRLRLQFEQEDRGIEKELLQHRMRELKISERLQARQAAAQNLQMMSGQSQANLPEEALDPLTPRDEVAGVESEAFGEGPAQRMLRPVEIPGIEELGIPGASIRPQTMEQQLAQQMAALRLKESLEVRPVARGGSLVQGGREIFHNEYEDPADKVLVPVVNRDRSGKETTTYMKRSEIPEGFQSTRERLPQRTSTAQTASATDIADFVSGVVRGDTPATEIPISALGVKIRSELARQGFNLTRAQQEQTALRTHYSTLNTGERANLRVAADATTEALDALEELNEQWKVGNWGPMSWVRVTAAKAGGLGDLAKTLAGDIEAAVAAVRENLATLKSGGSAPTNRTIAEAESALSARSSPASLEATIRRLRQAVGYKRSAITGLEAVTPTTQAGEADFDYDPATGTLKPRR